MKVRTHKHGPLHGRVETESSHIEWIVTKPKPEFSARFAVGGLGSETPFDAHLTILGTGAYLGIGKGHKIADKLTHQSKDAYGGREITVRVHGGKLRWSVWTRKHMWQCGEFAKWRDANVSLNPLDYLFGGEPRYHYEDVSVASADLRLIEATYPLTLTLQRVRLRRKRGPSKWSWSIDWTTKVGIPTEGYGRGRVYGCAVNVDGDRDWIANGIAYITAWVYGQRARYGYREPTTVEPASDHPEPIGYVVLDMPVSQTLEEARQLQGWYATQEDNLRQVCALVPVDGAA